MLRTTPVFLLVACGALSTLAAVHAIPNHRLVPDFVGTWAIDLAHSDEVPAWKQMELVISIQSEGVTITRNLGWGRRRFTDSITIVPDSGAIELPIEWWADNRHLGVYASDAHVRTVQAYSLDDGRTLRTETHFMVETQQSPAPMRITCEYRLSPDGDRLTLIELRSSRSTPIACTFTRKP